MAILESLKNILEEGISNPPLHYDQENRNMSIKSRGVELVLNETLPFQKNVLVKGIPCPIV